MSTLGSTLVGLGSVLILYSALVGFLYFVGRREDARAVGGFVPDCLVLFRRLIADPRVPRWRKALLVVLLAYLAMPIDLVPDFIPVAGQADDLLVVILVLRGVLRGGGEALVRDHWPGPESSVALLLRLAYGRAALADGGAAPRVRASRTQAEERREGIFSGERSAGACAGAGGRVAGGTSTAARPSFFTVPR